MPPQSDKVNIIIISTVLQRRKPAKTNQPRSEIPQEESDWPSVGHVSSSVHRVGEEGATGVRGSKLATIQQKAVLRGALSLGAATLIHVCWSVESGCEER